MSWRSSTAWELRARLSPELVAGFLAVVVVVIALVGIFGLAAPGRPEPAPRDSFEPSASAGRFREPTNDATPDRPGLLPILVEA